jgi:hypothetical protein
MKEQRLIEILLQIRKLEAKRDYLLATIANEKEVNRNK